jgi:hypothetical protein
MFAGSSAFWMRRVYQQKKGQGWLCEERFIVHWSFSIYHFPFFPEEQQVNKTNQANGCLLVGGFEKWKMINGK